MSQTVISVVDDMFFASKIRAVAEAAGVEISFPRSGEAVVSKAREIKSHEDLRDIRLLGFFSHVQTELKNNAVAAGFDQVIPRSVFARDLEQILTADLRE